MNRRRALGKWALAAATLLALSSCGSALPLSKIAEAAHGNESRSGSTAVGVGSVTGPGGSVGGGTGSGGQIGSSGAKAGSGSGGSESPTASSGATGGTNGTGGISSGAGGGDHTPILVGSVGDYSGAPGAVLAYEPETLQVWAKWENAHGGVDGHPIQVIVEDDGGNPSTYQSDIEDLVNNKHVLAFVDNGANLTAQAGESFLDSKQIPVIGAGDGNSAWTTNQMYFNLQAATDALIGGELLEAKNTFHVTKVADLACVESQACTSYYNDSPRLAAALGMQVVYSAHISITQPDFTSECLQAQSNGAQVVEGIGDENTFHRIVESCLRQGYHPDWIAPSPNDGDSQVSGLTNVVGANGAFPFDGDATSPAVAEYVRAFKTYAPGSILSQYTALSWAAAKLFQHVIDTSIGTSVPTTPKILAGLWAIKNFDVNGLELPLTYNAHTANAGTTSTCWFGLIFQNNRWNALNGLTPMCDSRV